MALNLKVMLLFLLFYLLSFTFAAAQWSISSLTSIQASSSGSISFTLERSSSGTACHVTWTQSTPTSWTTCADPLLRFRIASYNSASNYSLAIASVTIASAFASLLHSSKPIKLTTLMRTAPVSLTVTNSTLSITSASCTTTASGTTCTTATTSLNPSTENFTPSPLTIFWFLSRSDGQADIPCTQAWTIYVENPSVACLGPLTLGRGSKQPSWETICESTWNCGSSDPFLNTWSSCQAPAYQIQKSYPSGVGDSLSNFLLSITHEFPLMMATSVRGTSSTDYGLTDPNEAEGFNVKLTFAPSAWKDGETISAIMSGGIDQTGDCATGCEFGNNGYTYPEVVLLEII